jgi:iron complex outermembrane recepter protein
MFLAGVSQAHAEADAPAQGGLQEIIVTAQKRSENVQKVPISIATISAAALQRNGVTTSRDLEFSVPTLVYNQASNNAQPFLRGIGSDTNGPNYDVSVATYVDGVFISSNAAVIQGLLGVDRVEVLEGPQGTLYGRNAVGGAINIYTRTPGAKTEAGFDVTSGNYNLVQTQAYLSGAVTDTLSVGIYGGYYDRDSYFTRQNNSLAEPQTEQRYGVRVKAVWTPLPALKLTGSVEYIRTRSFEDGAFRNVQDNSLSFDLARAFGLPVDNSRYHIDADQAQFVLTRDIDATLREELDLGFAQALGITAYRNFKSAASDDLDGTPLGILVDYTPDEPSRQFSQELQLISKPGSAITWIGGIYYFHEYSGYDPVDTMSPSGILFPSPIVDERSYVFVKTDSFAAFGQVTAPLDFVTPGLKLTLGGRYTIDSKRFEPAESMNLDSAGAIVGAVTTFPELEHSWRKFTPKVTLDYTFGGTLLYASYSKGFKSGAYNIATPADPGPVNPETLNAFEIGFKSRVANWLRWNGAAYDYDFSNIQTQLVDGTTGRTSIQNAASARAHGIETQLTVAPVHDLTFNASAAWEHSRYSSFPNAATYLLPGETVRGTTCAGPVNCSYSYDATGNQMQRAPEWVFSTELAYDHVNDDRSGYSASIKWYHNGGYFWEATNRFRQQAYSLVNASIGYTLPGGQVTVSGFVTNLTNARYENALLVLPISVVVLDGEPRFYGATLRYRW